MIAHPRLALVLPPLGLLLSASCNRNNSPNTGIIVEITSDLRVPDEIDQVHLTTKNSQGNIIYDYTYDLGEEANQFMLPFRAGLYPLQDTSAPIHIEAVGQLSSVGQPVVSRSATLSFVTGKKVVLELPLLAVCKDVSCKVAYSTCQASGKCDSDTVDSTTLPEYVPNQPVSATDAATQIPDAQMPVLPMDAAVEKVSDAAVDRPPDLASDVASGRDAFFATGGAGGTDAPSDAGGAIGTDVGAVVADARTEVGDTPRVDRPPDVPVGGSSGVGGTPATGGTTAGGGTSAGGTTASGGITASGGSAGTGGLPTSGGITTAGGTTASGGTTRAGGTTTIGGTTASGGTTSAGGSATAGGTTGGTTSSPGGTTSAPGGGGSGGGVGDDAGASDGGAGDTGGTDSGGCTLNSPGAPMCPTAVGTGSPGLIDDFSDGDGFILPNDGRQGVWYVYNDGMGIQTPAPFSTSCALPLPSGGKMCTSGSGFSSWGAGIALTLNASAECVAGLYDASAYTGVTFTISGTVQSGYLRFNITTASTEVPAWGGTCLSTTKCTDYYGVDLTPLTTPQTFTYYFSDLEQQGWGTPVAWDPGEMLTLQWGIHLDFDILGNPIDAASFSDICIYDVAFFSTNTADN